MGDYRFETLPIDLDEVIDAENEVEMWDLYEEHFGGQGHKIGGYPFLHKPTQENGKKHIKNITFYSYKLIQMMI